MADNRKEQERDELHRMIWGIANDLRGSVDGWDFKQYVLGMLFYRYISENFANYMIFAVDDDKIVVNILFTDATQLPTANTSLK